MEVNLAAILQAAATIAAGLASGNEEITNEQIAGDSITILNLIIQEIGEMYEAESEDGDYQDTEE